MDKRHSETVLYKTVFSNIFHKDIRRAFIYKRSERLGNALYLIAPAFNESLSLKERAETIALALPAAAMESASSFQSALARELLNLSSLLSMARAAGVLSAMNADLIDTEVQVLLEDVGAYEEPRIPLVESATIAELARRVPSFSTRAESQVRPAKAPQKGGAVVRDGSVSTGYSDRQQSILSLLKEKGPVSIRDISSVISGVSEKTVQRELQALISQGLVVKEGERRWSRYSVLANTEKG